MLSIFIAGIVAGVLLVGFAFDIRRALTSAQKRDQETEQHFAKLNRGRHV